MISTVAFFVCLLLAAFFELSGDTVGACAALVLAVLSMFWNR